MIVVDEAGFLAKASIHGGGVLLLCFIRQPRQIMLLSSTPPKTAGPVCKPRMSGTLRGTAASSHLRAADNPSQKEREGRGACRPCRREEQDSTDWRREALCELDL